ncbi:MAG: hypothetical protein ACK44E_09540, partial [Anaerolineales bacterium]
FPHHQPLSRWERGGSPFAQRAKGWGAALSWQVELVEGIRAQGLILSRAYRSEKEANFIECSDKELSRQIP